MELSKLNSYEPPSPTKHRDDVVSTWSFGLAAWDPFRRNNIRAVSYLIIIAIVFYLATVYTFSPSDGYSNKDNTMQLVLSQVRVHVDPRHTVDVSLNATVAVKDRARSYSLDYSTLHVEVCHKGKELGNVTFKEGEHVSRMGSSYVDATVEVAGVEVDSDDLANGLVLLDIVAHVDGFLSCIKVPVKAKYSCETLVDINEHKIVRQICNPMAMDFGFSFSLPMPFRPAGQVVFQIIFRF